MIIERSTVCPQVLRPLFADLSTPWPISASAGHQLPGGISFGNSRRRTTYSCSVSLNASFAIDLRIVAYDVDIAHHV